MSFFGSIPGFPELGMGAVQLGMGTGAFMGSAGLQLGMGTGGLAPASWQNPAGGGVLVGAGGAPWQGPGTERRTPPGGPGTKWPRKEDMPVDPLDPERQLGIQKLLEESGGVLPLGRVTEVFPGLKRMQLQGIFELNKVGNDGQFEVRIPGCMSTGAEIMFQGQALSKDQQLPQLDAESIARVRLALEQEPGFTLPMAKIRELVPGVNKKQLENDFEVVRIDKKHFNIALKQGSGPGDTRLGDQWRAVFQQRFGVSGIAVGAAQEDPAAKRMRTE